MNAALNALYRRALNLIGRGRVKQVDDTKSVQLIQIEFGPLETRDKTPRVGHYGFAYNPPDDSDVIVLCVGGDRDNAVAIATNHQASRLKNLARGEVALFHQDGRFVKLGAAGIVVEAGNKPIDVNNATVVTIKASTKVRLETPLLEVTGQITAGGNITDATRSMAGDRAKYNAHTHPGVTAGGASTGTTSQPE